MNRVVLIIVLYNPTTATREKWLSYVDCLSNIFFCFVDNSKEKYFNVSKSNAAVFSNRENLGIAKAQNIGIKYAIENNFDKIIFFDQDSDFEKDYIQDILEEFNLIKRKNPKIAVLGPTIIHKDSCVEYKHNDFVNDAKYAIVSHLISSGSIVDVDSFNAIGLMNEKMFIDYVDFEWCWRACFRGYFCARTHNVFLKHKVGQKDSLFLGYPIVISSPTRYYYQYRNYLWLLKCNYVPFKWKIKTFIRKTIELFILPCIVDKKLETAFSVIAGIKAGVKKNEIDKRLCERR